MELSGALVGARQCCAGSAQVRATLRWPRGDSRSVRGFGGEKAPPCRRASSAQSRRPNCSTRAAADAATPAAAQAPRRPSVPGTVEESVDQAKAAIRRALADGQRRLQLDLVLPLIGPSLLDDWPGGIQQQLEAATPLVTSILEGIAVDGKQVEWKQRLLNQEDAVVQWESPVATFVLFPTADTIPALRELPADQPLIMANPQWQPGQVVSDFGLGNRRKDAEEFVKTFVTVYSLKSTRIAGSDVTLIRSYPSEWCVFAVDEEIGGFNFVAGRADRPAYREIEAMLRDQRKASGKELGWMEKLSKELKFLRDSK